MRRCFSFAFGIALLLAGVGGAQADSIDALAMVRQYAATLEHFDTRLDAAQATRLALRTLAESSAYGIDARLVVALVAIESSWNPAAVSSAGAHGLGQLMPQTAAGLGVNPDNADANLDGTIRHLRWLLGRYERFPPQSRFERSIAAYNAGAGAVDHYGGVPPYAETQEYVRRVVGLWRRLAGL